MGRRRTFEIPGVRHTVPIPLAAQAGNMVCSSALTGMGASTGKLPEDGPSRFMAVAP